MKSFQKHPDPAADEPAALWAATLDGSLMSATDRAALDEWLSAQPDHRALLSRYCQFSADLEQQMPLIEGIRDLSAGARITPATAQVPLAALANDGWCGSDRGCSSRTGFLADPAQAAV